ncbi:P-loop containing nucleoside triphosphate hydrolase protein, partial [Mycena floridula]
WQIHLINRVFQGYDSVFVAGTGYGKSLIFEGLAALGEKGKLVIVVSPLKALEKDQVRQAIANLGIDALVINEDMEKSADLWRQMKSMAQMVYLLPEMALSDSFSKLWQDVRFRKRITAVVVDEAHSIAPR